MVHVHYEDKLTKKSKAVCMMLCLEHPFGDLQGWYNLNCPHYHFALGQEYLSTVRMWDKKELQQAGTEKEKDEDEGKSHSEHLENKCKTKSYIWRHKRP